MSLLGKFFCQSETLYFHGTPVRQTAKFFKVIEETETTISLQEVISKVAGTRTEFSISRHIELVVPSDKLVPTRKAKPFSVRAHYGVRAQKAGYFGIRWKDGSARLWDGEPEKVFDELSRSPD